MNPTVSIIVVTYNRASLISDLLDSILNQVFIDWECIIINDGGNDETDRVVGKYLRKDKRFTYIYRPAKYKKGLPGCRNYGLDLAKGTYIVFFDDDDIVHPDILRITTTAITTGTYDFCHYQKQSFIESKELPKHIMENMVIQGYIDFNWLYRLITYDYAIASCTVLWKKDFLNERFNEALQYAEEWEFYNRLFMKQQEFKGLIIENVLYFNRKHPESNTHEFYNGNRIRVLSHSRAAANLLSNYFKYIAKKETPVIQYLLTILIRNRSLSLYNHSVSLLFKGTLKRFILLLLYFILPIYLNIINKYKKWQSKSILNYF